MAVHKEIERKFLVQGMPWTGHTGMLIRQAYLVRSEDRILRVRQKGDHFFVTLKIGTGMSRIEFEHQVSAMEGEALLNYHALESPIQKMRYEIPFLGNTWEVDVFWGDNSGLIMAEIELRDIDENFIHPAWLREEVTGDERYMNSYIAQHPFGSWPVK